MHHTNDMAKSFNLALQINSTSFCACSVSSPCTATLGAMLSASVQAAVCLQQFHQWVCRLIHSPPAWHGLCILCKAVLTWPLQRIQGSSDMASAAYTRQFWHGLSSLQKAALTWPLHPTQGSSGISPTVWLESVSRHCQSHNHYVLHKITACTHRTFHYKSNNMFMNLTKWFRNYSRPIYKLYAPSNCRQHCLHVYHLHQVHILHTYKFIIKFLSPPPTPPKKGSKDIEIFFIFHVCVK